MLSGKDLVSLGLKPNKQFGEILQKCKTFKSQEEITAFVKVLVDEQNSNNKAVERQSIPEGSVLWWFLNDTVLRGLVPENLEGRAGRGSNSEIRRLFENHSVLINGFAPPPDAWFDNQFEIWQLVFFPKGNRKTTLVDKWEKHDSWPWVDCDFNPLQ